MNTEGGCAIAVVAVLDTRYPDLSVEESVLAEADVDIIRNDASDAEAVMAVGDADVIIVGSRARFTDAVLQAISARAIVRAGIGVDGVDLDAASLHGVRVSNVPDYGTEAVAQHALAAALAGTRRLVEANRMVASGDWGFMELRPMHLPSHQTAGVIGQGRIGRRVAELFHAVGFGRVIAHDPFVDGPYLDGAVGAATFEEVVGESDVVSLHVPGGETPLFDADVLGRMKQASVLVNTARGSLIDPVALAAALRAGAPRVACLDVFVPEPPDLEVFDGVMDRLILSPHQAWYTEESQADLRQKSAEEALRLIRGEAPKYAVNDPEAPR